jgi:YVTN family beta-propeller protein
MRHIPTIVITLISVFLLTIGCSEESPNVPPTNNTNGFQTEAVAKVFSDNCATSGCHVGSSLAGGLSISSLSELLKGSTDRSGGTIPNYGGESIIPFRLDESLLYQILLGNVTPAAPHDVVSLSQAETDTIKNWLMNGARDNNNILPFQNPSYRVYVCNQNSDKISVIDGDSKLVSAIIDVTQPSLQSANPHMVKEEGEYLYSTLIGAGKLLKIRKSDNEIVGEVSGITKAGMIQIHPNGMKAYVSRSSTSQPNFDQIVVVDIVTMQKIKDILLPAPGVPHGLAITPDGKKLFVGNLTLDRLSVIDAETDEYRDDIILTPQTEPMQTTVSPDGKYLYVSSRGFAQILVYNTETDTLVTQVPVSGMPMHIAITSDGNKIYVGSMMMHNINVIEKNGNTWTKTKEITHPGFSMLHGCDISADDRYVYVSSRNTNDLFKPYFDVENEGPPGTIGIIDTQTDEVVKLFEIEEFGSGLVVEK